MEEDQLKAAIQQSLISQQEDEKKRTESNEQANNPFKGLVNPGYVESINEFKKYLPNEEQRKEESERIKKLEMEEQKKREEEQNKIVEFFKKRSEQPIITADIPNLAELEKEKEKKLREYSNILRQNEINARIEQQKKEEESLQQSTNSNVDDQKMTLRQQLANRLKQRRAAVNK